MSVLVLETIFGSALMVFWVQILFAGRRAAYVDSLNISLMAGFIFMGCLAYLVRPDLGTTVEMLSFYSPHAYNLIIWPGAALLVLRKRFEPSQFFPVFVFVYGLDEIIWNGLAVAKYFGDWHTLAYFGSEGFLSFFAVLCVAVSGAYWFVRPKLSANSTWLMLGVFAVFWAFVAGFPIIAVTDAAALSFVKTLYLVAWEILWQTAFWVFVYASVRPRTYFEPLPFLQDRPSVG